MESNTIRINPEKTYTKTEYSKVFNIGRVTLDKKIKEKTIKSIVVKGTTLVLA